MDERILLVLWVTARCNLQCTYCYANGGAEGRDMELSTAKRAIDALRSRPLKIQFAGGEPLMNFGLVEQICRYVQEEGIDAVFQLQTNGTLVTEEIAQSLAEHRISVGVSMDGVPEIHRRTRGSAVKVVEGIRTLGSAGLAVGLNAVVTRENAGHLHKLVDLAFYLGNVGGIGLDLLRHAGRGTEELDVEPEELRQALIAMDRRSRELQRLFGRKISLREVELAKKRLSGAGCGSQYCYASCGRSVVVLPDGTTYPCGSLRTEDYCMGAVEELAPDRIMSLRADSPDSCGICRYGAYCPRGCPSRRLLNGNRLDCVLLKTAFSLAEGEYA